MSITKLVQRYPRDYGAAAVCPVASQKFAI